MFAEKDRQNLFFLYTNDVHIYIENYSVLAGILSLLTSVTGISEKSKESEYNMKLVESILKKNPCYLAGREITVKGLMLHSVGCSQPKATVFINSWNKESYSRACVHGFIDGNDGTVYQTLPWNYEGKHAGKSINGSANKTHIGVEMCEPATIEYTNGLCFKVTNIENAKMVANRTYDAAVELFAMLCETYGLNPLDDGVIISHNEGHERGIASGSGDPEHLWEGLGLSYTMDGFRADVKATMGTGGYTLNCNMTNT